MVEFVVDHFFWFWLGSIVAVCLGLMGAAVLLSKHVDGGLLNRVQGKGSGRDKPV